jgi:hypothetical protein
MLNSISFYIILTLSGLLSVSAYFTYTQIQDIAVANKTIEDQAKVVSDYENSTKLAKQSCDTDVQSVVELSTEQTEVRTKIDDLVVKIGKLKTGVAISNTEAPKNATTTIYGTELLSLDLRLLLNQAYCLASPEDNLCRTK